MAAPCGVLVFAGSFHAGRGILLHQLAERREGLLVEGLEEHVIGIPVVLQRAKKLSRVAKRTTTRRPITTWQGAPSHGVAERRARGLQRRAPPPPPLARNPRGSANVPWLARTFSVGERKGTVPHRPHCIPGTHSCSPGGRLAVFGRRIGRRRGGIFTSARGSEYTHTTSATMAKICIALIVESRCR